MVWIKWISLLLVVCFFGQVCARIPANIICNFCVTEGRHISNIYEDDVSVCTTPCDSLISNTDTKYQSVNVSILLCL
jgi:hypothetical protein